MISRIQAKTSRATIFRSASKVIKGTPTRTWFPFAKEEKTTISRRMNEGFVKNVYGMIVL